MKLKRASAFYKPGKTGISQSHWKRHPDDRVISGTGNAKRSTREGTAKMVYAGRKMPRGPRDPKPSHRGHKA